jgi:hypothetical protein
LRTAQPGTRATPDQARQQARSAGNCSPRRGRVGRTRQQSVSRSRSALNPGLRDHNLIRWLASRELSEPKTGRPAGGACRSCPLLTTRAPVVPVRHGSSTVRGSGPVWSRSLRRFGSPRPGTDRPAGHGKADYCGPLGQDGEATTTSPDRRPLPRASQQDLWMACWRRVGRPREPATTPMASAGSPGQAPGGERLTSP